MQEDCFVTASSTGVCELIGVVEDSRTARQGSGREVGVALVGTGTIGRSRTRRTSAGDAFHQHARIASF